MVLGGAGLAVTDADPSYEEKKLDINEILQNNKRMWWSRGPNECGYIEINS